ncbi:MAG TPA: helix-turn-helix domain-containing protein [Candidatus Bathyarchaeia archaeon]|nr:helix-turn-helix domain-containing protein [Candidatus Bathyarchaeia archaeon]
MESDDEFIRHLISFGLTEKEAQCYFYLLKYGPKTPSPLAKSLKTYREDVHRTLSALIDKGMVLPSLDSPTLYTAVELETALQSAVKKHETELVQMEQRKRQLEELSREQRFRPSDEVSTFKIIKNLKELVTTMLPIVSSLEEEWLSVAPSSAVVISSQFGINDFTKEFIERGGKVRFIVGITYPVVEMTRELLDIGVKVRHSDKLGILFTVFDRKTCISAINVEFSRFSLDTSLAALWTNDQAYAQYLTSTFELLWDQSIPAEEQIQALLKAGPPQA